MPRQRNRVLMILENCSYLRDARVGKEAQALTRNGYVVSVISPELGRLPCRLQIDGVTIYGFPQVPLGQGTLGYLLEYAYATLAIATITAYVWLTRGFDFVHVANPPDCLVPVLSIYKILGIRVIYDQHDLSPELYVARFSRSSALLLRIQLRLESLSYQLADRVIVTNESYRKIALRRGGQPETKITVVRNGPDLERFQALRVDEDLRKRSPNIIAFAGITGYQDGLDYLCRALHSLCRDLGRTDFLCIVLGDGDALPDIKRLAHELQIDEQIWFVGWVNDLDVYFRYLSTADICVAPEPSNTYNDNSTFVKIMEYMLAGKPIVAFDLPESRVSAEGSALYASPNNFQDFAVKLAALMDDPAMRSSMGTLGRRRIETTLAWQHSIPSLLAAYDRVSQPHSERALSAKRG
ncbi:MAG: glycosyltransferase family 4 protein [Terriglobales bacterium]